MSTTSDEHRVVRMCGVQDMAAMQLLRLRQTRHAGGDTSEYTSQILMSVAPMYFRPPHFAIGAWADNKLVGYICAEVHAEFWNLDLMIGGGDAEALRACLDRCLEVMEDQGVFEFYYAFPKKWGRLYRSFWKSGVVRLRKYVVTDIVDIPKCKRPADEFVWKEVVKQYMSPVNLTVRKSEAQC